MTRARLQAVHPVLGSRDVAASIIFYARIGFSRTYQDQPTSPRYAALRRDDVELHVQWQDTNTLAASADRPVFRCVVDDVDGLSAEFALIPGLDRTDITNTPWGTREFHVRDPDGNGLQFYRDC